MKAVNREAAFLGAFFLAAPLLALAGCEAPAPQEELPGVAEIAVAADQPLGEDPRAAPSEPGNLQRALAETRGPARLALGPGRHHLAPSEFTDVSCGNCPDQWESVPGTLGVLVSGSGIHIVGSSPDSVVIHTHAGYGIFFEGCHDCSLEGVTVTGGVRDPDDRATNGAVVARDATLRVADCRIRDNVGDSATVAEAVVGIVGVVGREGSEITVEGCRIERNSWDGIALYRGAEATIRGNVVDGVDGASGARIGGGRGVGIGLTWNAVATVEGNLVRNYWKGIGAFVDARARIHRNVVEDILTWGIAYWAAGDGSVWADIRENAVFRTGACGVMLSGSEVAEGEPGALAGNALVRTAQDPRYDSGEPYCSQEPVARDRLPPGFTVEANLLYDNRHPGAEEAPGQLDGDAFRQRAGPLLEVLAGYEALTESSFLAEFRPDD